MGNQISQLTSSDTSAPQIQLPKAGPAGPKGDKGDQGPPGNPALLLGTADFKNAVNKSIDPNVIKPKSLDLKYPGITDTEAILKLYGVDTGTTNYYLMKGGHGDNDNITIDALGNIVTNGNISEGQRLLGTLDGSGNFWMGLRGSGTEDERLAMGVSGEANTGKVKQVNIRKDLVVGTNPVKFSSGWSNYNAESPNNAEISNDTGSYKELMLLGNKSAGGNRQVGVWDNLNVHGDLQVGTNPVKFSSGWSSFTNASPNNSEISNDTGSFKQLMLVGNTSGGGVRKVGVWDRLDVHGDLVVDGGTNTRIIDLGYLDTTREGSAGKIGYGIFDENALAIVGKGKPKETRKVHLWDDVIVDRNLTAQGRVFSGTVDGSGGMWVDGEKRGGQFMGSRDPNSLGWYSNGDWRMWHENAGNQVIAQGRLSADDLVNRGNDFFLGTSDGNSGNGRGSFANGMNNGRAMVKYFSNAPDGTRAPVLYLNFGGDFPGGVRVSGPSLMVDGNLDSYNHTTLKGGKSEHNPNNWQTHFPYPGDQKNYIRGDTEIRGNTNNIGNLSVDNCLTIGAKNGGGHQLCSDGTNIFIKGAGGSNPKELRINTDNNSSKIMFVKADGNTQWLSY